MKAIQIKILILTLIVSNAFGQGRKNNWLVGYNSGTSPVTTCERAKISFNTGSTVIQPQTTRKINFLATEGNISDRSGNLLFSSNGVWIADAFGDTMQNGTGLNPGPMVNSMSNSYCLNLLNANLIIPYPGDSLKYILFHTVGNYNASLSATELFYTVIDMNLNGGLGGVIAKNQIAFNDTLMWSISAVKHANGRDWWVLMVKDNSDIIYKVLVTPFGIQNVSSQSMGGVLNYKNSVGQSCFSPDGKKFAYSSGYVDMTGGIHYITDVRVFDFDRCSGSITNYHLFSTSNFEAAGGVCFSSSSRYLYVSTVAHVFQIDANAISPTVDTVAVNDGYYSPIPPFQSDFFLQYLAEDGRIYITSGNSVIDFHYINKPDSAGPTCDVRQHALHLPCFGWRSIPNHPNYELGADSGSVCDTLQLGIMNAEFQIQNEVIRINPNPASDYFYINYNLTVNDIALFVLYDAYGKEVLRRNLYGAMHTLLVNYLELENGVYYYTVLLSNKIVDRGKVAVVR
ncbi:MAG: T9SS type A sorting domain-containing protein [Bacteroidetes bacterium]|nr:T9SS type A sorting domain-containing protein [Bacteroidota bacterium]